MQSADTLINDGRRIQAWMHDQSGLPIQRDFHGIARVREDRIVAAFGYDSFQPSGCQLHICAEPGGLNRRLLFEAFRTPFIQWNFTYLVGIIQASNVKSLSIAKHLGFSKFGEIPGQLEFFVMYREDCRHLKLAERLHERRRINPIGPES